MLPSIELAFQLTRDLGGVYYRDRVREAFIKRAIEVKLLERLTKDIFTVLGMKA